MVIHPSPECIRRVVRQSNSSIVPVSYDRNNVDGDVTHGSDHGRHRTRYAVIVHLSAKNQQNDSHRGGRQLDARRLAVSRQRHASRIPNFPNAAVPSFIPAAEKAI